MTVDRYGPDQRDPVTKAFGRSEIESNFHRYLVHVRQQPGKRKSKTLVNDILPRGKPSRWEPLHRQIEKLAAQSIREGFVEFATCRRTRAIPHVLDLHAEIILAGGKHARRFPAHFFTNRRSVAAGKLPGSPIANRVGSNDHRRQRSRTQMQQQLAAIISGSSGNKATVEGRISAAPPRLTPVSAPSNSASTELRTAMASNSIWLG